MATLNVFTLSVKYFENTPSVKKSTPSVKMIYAKCNCFYT